MQQHKTQSPRLSIETAHCRAGAAQGQCRAAWHIHNLGEDTVGLLSTWLPHDKFAHAPQGIDPPVQLAPGERTVLELSVACHEQPGSVVENAYVILRVLWREEPWRVFVRLRVTVDDAGIPQPLCESVTLHPVGFSSRSGAHPSAREGS